MNDRTLIFTNATPVPWTAAVWQELSGGSGLTSVAWQLGTVLPGGNLRLGWSDAYAVALSELEDVPPGGIFHITSFVGSRRDWMWEVITIGGLDYLADAGESPEPGAIVVANRSTGPVNAGLMQSGSAVAYAQHLPSGLAVKFAQEPPPQFRFGLFLELQRGQVIDPLLVRAGPVTLPFSPLVNNLLVTAAMQGQTVVLTVVPA